MIRWRLEERLYPNRPGFAYARVLMHADPASTFHLGGPGDWIAPIIIAVTIAGVAIGRIPYLRMNRATIALVGATALVLSGGLQLETAFSLLDWNTLSLLLAMMILNANLRICGFFQWVSARLLQSARKPTSLWRKECHVTDRRSPGVRPRQPLLLARNRLERRAAIRIRAATPIGPFPLGI